MTLTWNESTYAFNLINFTWNGAEISEPVTGPVQIPITVRYLPNVATHARYSAALPKSGRFVPSYARNANP